MKETPPTAEPQGSPAPRLTAETVAALFAQHGEELRRFLVGVLRDQALAADVVQTTFATLLERGEETREETRKAWLFRVAYNEALGIRRREATGGKILQKLAWQGTRTTPLPEARLLQSEETSQMLHLLDQLSPDQRQIVRLRIYEEKTFAEISRELNIPLGTALGRMRAALQKLKTLREPS